MRDIDFHSARLSAQIAVPPALLARALEACGNDIEYRAHAGSGVAQIMLADQRFDRRRRQHRRAMARSRALGARYIFDCSPPRLRFATQLEFFDTPNDGALELMRRLKSGLRPGRDFQPRMLRRRNLMAEPAATSPSPVRDVIDYELLFDCVHCGLCAEACPTYIVTRGEMDSPRGRIYLMKSLAEGRIELDDDAARHLDLCLGCRGCETACPSGVHYGRLIEGARSYRRTSSSVAGCSIESSAALVSAVFPYPNRLARDARAARSSSIASV